MKNTYRMKENKVFKYVLRKGNYAKGKYLVVHITSMKSKVLRNYLGICVSKKNGNSVVRNKLKRWVRECYKLEENALKIGFNIVVLYKKSATISDLDFMKVQQDIKKCLKDLDLYGKTIKK